MNVNPESKDLNKKRRKRKPLNKLPRKKLKRNQLLPSVKTEEEEIVRVNSDLLF